MSDRPSNEPSGFEQHRYAPPADAVEIILVRHGASEAAQPGQSFPLVDGQGDPALSEAGRGQARLAAAALAGEAVAGLFASNLRRTQETARPLAEEKGLEVQVLPDLREIFLGDLEGGAYRIKLAEGAPIVAEAVRKERWDVIPGAESPKEFASRLRAAVAEVVAAVPPGCIAVAVAHGAVIGELCAIATGSRPFAFIHVDNGSISRLVVHGDGSWLLRSFNETQHLEAPAG